MAQIVGRFAPTPSGYAHIGNLFCYLLAWLSAKRRGGRIVLRMEDLDTQRTSMDLARETMEDLLWLGLDWDEGPRLGEEPDVYYQSRRGRIYEEYFQKLCRMGYVYPCFCSRADVKNACAPHASDGRTIYPGTCRGLSEEEAARLALKRKPAWRFRVEDRTIHIHDRLQGEYAQALAEECGDFPVRRADGTFCYQLAVVIDDALMGVNEVVRANDLLSSTPQQKYLCEVLGLPCPEYVHIPTVLDSGGNRLAKRDRSVSLRDLKSRYAPEEVLGRLACLAGLQRGVEPVGLDSLLDRFSWDLVPREDIRVPEGLF